MAQSCGAIIKCLTVKELSLCSVAYLNPGPSEIGWCPGKTVFKYPSRGLWIRAVYTVIIVILGLHIFHIAFARPGLSIVQGLATGDNRKCITWSQGDEHEHLQLALLSMYSVPSRQRESNRAGPTVIRGPRWRPQLHYQKRLKHSNRTVILIQQSGR